MLKNARALTRLIGIVVAGYLLAAAPACADDSLELDEGLAIVGIIVGAEERDAVDAIVENGKFLLPAEATFDAMGIVLRETEGEASLDTPIGAVAITPEALREEDGIQYVTQSFLEGPLSTRVKFDPESYAVILEIPWKSGDPVEGSAADAPEIEPDFEPSMAGLTSFHGDIFGSYSSSNPDETITSELELNGHAAGGVWRLRYSGDLNNQELADYAWLREANENIWVLLGRQQIGVHPLVDVVDMTGAQVAYSNRPSDFEQIEEVSGNLLDRTGGSGRRFVGDGPPGGRVELVIDGMQIAETLIDVNGLYTLEHPLLGEQRSDIEIRVFEPLSDNQIDSIEMTVTANRLVAPKGTFNIVGGIGAEGDFLDQDGMSGVTAFARARYAPFDDATIEAAVVFDPDDGIEASVGAAVQLGKLGSLYAAAGMQDDGTTAFEGLYYGSYGKASATLRSRYRQAPDQDEDDLDDQGERADDFDYFAEVNYDYSSRLRFGAIARHTVETSFALPYAIWHPYSGVVLSARPNRDGEYRFEARATPFKDIDLLMFYEGSGFARISHRFVTEATGDSAVSLDLDYDQDEGNLGIALGLNGSRLFGLNTRWNLRAARNNSGTTGAFGLSHELRPGVSAYLDGGIRMYDDDREDEQFATLGLSFDLGLAQGNLTAAPRRGVNPRYGRVAGRILLPEGVELSEEDIAGAQVVIDGQPAGRVDTDGDYWLPRVETGIRSVRLEADSLPIDLVIDTGTSHARIAPGAVTVLNFGVAIEVGAAGRITDANGEPVQGVPLQMTDEEGNVIARANSNQFGLFRLDGLPPGSYMLKAVGRWAGAERAVEIGTEYAFGTNLEVGEPSEPAKDTKPKVTRP